MESWGNKCFPLCFSSLFPKAKFQILLFDRCPTLASSISSTPVSLHCGISDAHICETFLSLEKKKLSRFTKIFKLTTSSHEPLEVDRWWASCSYFLRFAQGWRVGTVRHSPSLLCHGSPQSPSFSLHGSDRLSSLRPVCIRGEEQLWCPTCMSRYP